MRTKVVVAILLATGMLAVVQAQQGRQGGMGFFGFATGPSVMVQNPGVQEELKMKEDQIEKVNSWAKDFSAEANEIRKKKGVETPNFKGGKGFTPPSAEQLEKMAAANAEINKRAYKELGDFLSKDQVTRLKEIYRQARGLEAFNEADVSEALKLTDSQKTQLKTLSTDMGKELRELFAGAVGGFDAEKLKEMQTKMQKLRADYVGKAVDLLTDEQKKTWKGLVGAPFDASKLVQRRQKD